MTVNDTDKFLVNRSGSSYHLEAQNLMAELQDDDLMLVNRSGKSYKATGAEIKESLKPPAEVIKPQIIAPADGAGQGVEIETDIITEVSSTTPTTYKYWLGDVVDSQWSEFATAGNGYPQPSEANVGDAGTGNYGKVYHVDCGTPGGKFGLKPGLTNNTDYGEVLIFVSDDGVNYRLQQTVPGGDQNLKDIILTARYGRISRNGDFGPQYWGIWNAGTVDYLGFASAKSLLLFNAGDPVRQNDDAATATYQSYTINNSLNQYRMYISGITGTFVANAGKYVIGPEVLSGDAAVDPSGVNFLGSTFASSDGSLVAGSADWQVTTLADTGYSSIVSEVEKHPDMTDPRPKWTSGALEGGTEYRARTKYYAASGEESPWSDDVTFKTADDAVLVGVPADWVRNESGASFGNKKLINAFCGGYKVCWGGVAVDGTVAFAAVGTDITNWITDPDGVGYVSAGCGYSKPYFILKADGKLLYKGEAGVPTSLSGFNEVATDVTLAGNFGATQRQIGFAKSDGKIYTLPAESHTNYPASLGYTSVNANTVTEIPVQLPEGEKVKRFLSCAGKNYFSYGWVVMTYSGKIYQFGQKITNPMQASGGTASAPIDVTPPGEKIVSLAFASAASNTYHGCFAISQSGKLYGYMGGKDHGPLKQVAWSSPFSLIDDSATYIEMTTNYLYGGEPSSYVMRHTVEHGLQYAKPTDSEWKDLAGSVNTDKKMFGAYQYNSGAVLNYPNLLMPSAE